MKFFVDTADVAEIRELAEAGLLDGVTTNPSLIKKANRPMADIIAEICDIVDGPVSVLRAHGLRERRLTLDLVNEREEVSDPAVRLIAREGARVQLAFDPAEVSTTELISRITARHLVRDLFVENPPIEEVVARLYAEKGG